MTTATYFAKSYAYKIFFGTPIKRVHMAVKIIEPKPKPMEVISELELSEGRKPMIKSILNKLKIA